MGFVEIVLLIGIIPLDLPVTDTVSQIEVNHFFDDSGKHIFDQVIAKDFNKWTCQYECRAVKVHVDNLAQHFEDE